MEDSSLGLSLSPFLVAITPGPPIILSIFLSGLLSKPQQFSGAELSRIFCSPGVGRGRPQKWIDMGRAHTEMTTDDIQSQADRKRQRWIKKKGNRVTGGQVWNRRQAGASLWRTHTHTRGWIRRSHTKARQQTAGTERDGCPGHTQVDRREARVNGDALG